MAILAINTAGSTTEIAVIQTPGAQAAVSDTYHGDSWRAQNDEAERLMPAIDQLLTEAKTIYADLDNIFVIKGPGSFTGLRVGVTVANTIANLNHANLFAADTFEYWWQRAQGDERIDAHTALLIFAGKGGVYVSFVNGDASGATLVDLPDLKDYLDNHGIKKIFGDIIAEQKKVADREFIEINKNFAQTVDELMQKSLKPVKLVEPIYIKKPGITKPKKK